MSSGETAELDRVRPTAARRLFYAVYLACLLGLNGVVLLPNDGRTDGGGSPAFAASWIVLHVASMAVLVTSKRGLPSSGPPIAVLFGVYAATTALWSADAGASLLYGGMLTGNILVAYVLAKEASPREILRLLAGTIVLLSLAGIIAYYAGYGQVLWLDTRGRTNFFGGEFLRGFFPHRINGSLSAAIGIIAASIVYVGVLRLASLAILTLYMLLAASATGYVLLAVAAGVWILTSVAARKRLAVNSFISTRLLAIAAIAPFVWVAWSALLGALGRDATLTGRTLLWSWGLEAWQAQPILGWGYYAYFQTPSAQIEQNSIAELRYYAVPHFHQSYIQTAVDLGIVGFIGLLLILIATLLRSYRYGIHGNHREGVAFFTIVTVLAVGGFTIYVFPSYNHFTTFLLFLLYFSMRTRTDAVARKHEVPAA